MTGCPDAAALLEFVSGEAPGLDAHVSTCTKCHERATELRKTRGMLSDLADALRDEASDTLPARVGSYRILGGIREHGSILVLRGWDDQLRAHAEIHLGRREDDRSERRALVARAKVAVDGTAELLIADVFDDRLYFVATPGADVDAVVSSVLDARSHM
ncbi:MAG: hypothetical protein CMJ83_03270 [Planctomycetes bacterium]|nr:hypothetical protein [Planctomycetota bacterium]